jgi:2-C-methyl-D-erythritol 4-phosphate cytidylyltransferase
MAELGRTLYITPGSEINLKITNAEDLEIYKALLKTTQENWLK